MIRSLNLDALELSDFQEAKLREVEREGRLLEGFVVDGVLLEELSRLDSGATLLKHKIKRLLVKYGIKNPVNRDWLQVTYARVCKLLNHYHRRSEAVRKLSEIIFSRVLRERFGRDKEIIESAWIGPFQIDVLLLNVRGPNFWERSFNGIAYEIDGSIHRHEFKMIKDIKKENYLRHRFKMICKRIENQDIRTPTTQGDLIGLKGLRRLNTATLRTLRRNIAIDTIAAAHHKPGFRDRHFNLLHTNLDFSSSLLRDLRTLIWNEKRSVIEKRIKLYQTTEKPRRIKHGNF